MNEQQGNSGALCLPLSDAQHRAAQFIWGLEARGMRLSVTPARPHNMLKVVPAFCLNTYEQALVETQERDLVAFIEAWDATPWMPPPCEPPYILFDAPDAAELQDDDDEEEEEEDDEEEDYVN